MERILRLLKLASLIASVLVLPSCGGGSGGGNDTPAPAPATLGGVAAVGTPIVSGAIKVTCAAGSPLTTTSSNTGAWQVTLSGQTLPCAIQVSGGTINGATNSTSYHSIANTTGTVNVTPLTDLVVANLVGTASPATWFAGLSTNAAPLAAITQGQVATSLTKLGAALSGLTSLSANNPITTVFAPSPGNVSDDMLTALAKAMTDAGLTHASLVNHASVPVFTAPVSAFGTALTSAYKGTASGTSYTIGGAITGLNGSVILRNNGSDDLTVSTNGAFAFSTRVANGSPYNVTILSQPAGQTCSVSTGAGTVSGGNVANVAVVCSANTFSVGGSASGLAGSLVLQNNNGDNLTVTTGGAFTFATKIANGGAYNVTVLSRPAGQSCSVASGTGTIASANVNSVAVTCATNTYTIGGTVTGLSGSVVLQNNGGDSKTISTNGSFTFSTTVASGGAYNATVLTQPSGQTCVVTGGSGTATANVSSVTVNCINSATAPVNQTLPACPRLGSATGYTARFTAAQYDQITASSTRAQIDAILGCVGYLGSSTTTPGIGTLDVYTWVAGPFGITVVYVDYLNGSYYQKQGVF